MWVSYLMKFGITYSVEGLLSIPVVYLKGILNSYQLYIT